MFHIDQKGENRISNLISTEGSKKPSRKVASWAGSIYDAPTNQPGLLMDNIGYLLIRDIRRLQRPGFRSLPLKLYLPALRPSYSSTLMPSKKASNSLFFRNFMQAYMSRQQNQR